MSWMVAPVIFGGYAPDMEAGQANQFSPFLENIRFNPYGGIEKLDGFTGYSVDTSTFDTIRDIYDFLSAGGTYNAGKRRVGWLTKSSISDYYTIDNSRLYYLQRASVSGVATNDFAFLSGFTGCAAPNAYFKVLNSKLLISVSDGTTQPMLWDGTSSSLSAILTSPTGRYSEVHYDRAFLASSDTEGSRIWWSSIKDPATWGTATDYIDFDPDNGEKITGIKSYLGDLYVFKPSSVYKVTGNDFDAAAANFSVTKLTGVPGTPFGKTIVEANGELYWYSPEGVVKFNGSNITPIGYGKVDKKLKSLLISIPNPNFETMQAYHNKYHKEIWFYLLSSAYIYNIINGKWSLASYPHIAPTIMNTTYNGIDEIIYGGSLSVDSKPAYFTAIPSSPVYAYQGTGIGSGYITDWLDFGTMARKGNTRAIMDLKRTGDFGLSCQVYYDNSSTVQQSFVVNIGGAGNRFQDFYSDMLNYRNIKFSFANNTLNNKFTINKLFIEHQTDTESGRT